MNQTKEMPFSEIRTFVGRQRAAGRYNPATARNLEAACAHVEPVLEAGRDSIGYVGDNLDDILLRYGNLNPKVGQASIATYRARIRRAISDFIGHRTDPQWRPPSRQRRHSSPGEAAVASAFQQSKGQGASSVPENPLAL